MKSILLVSPVEPLVYRFSVQVQIFGAVELLKVLSSVITTGTHSGVHLLFEHPDFPELILVVYEVQIFLIFLLRRREDVTLEKSFNRMLKQTRRIVTFFHSCF